MAEGVGFEPTVGYQPTTVFKTAALSRSAIPPAWSPKERWARLMFRLASRPRFKGPAKRRLVVTITIADANRWLVL